MRLRGTTLVLLWTVVLSLCESQADVEDISEDDAVLKELGLYEEEADEEPNGNSDRRNQHRTLSPRTQPGNDDYEDDIEVDNPWDSSQPLEEEAEDDVEDALPDINQFDEETQSLEDEFMELREKHDSNFFEGALEYLERIVLQRRSDPRAASGPMSVLGFHYIHRRDYEKCASTFEAVDEVMSEITSGPGLLMEFCALMANDATSLKSLRKAVPLLRSAILSAKSQLEGERVQVLNEHLAMLSKRLADARGDSEIGAAGMVQRSARWYVDGLEAAPFHSPHQFPGATFLEERFETIKAEIDAFLNSKSVTSELRPMGEHTGGADAMLVLEGQWSDVSLYKGGVRNKRVCKTYFPKTCDIIEKGLPEAWTNNFCQVVISQLAPGTETRVHQGGTNAQLTMHLGIKAPPSAGLKVGDQIVQPGWSEGKAVVFDDSFEHQVWHRGDQHEGPRIVLVVRIWHPSFSLPERLDVIEKNAFKMDSREVKKRSKYLQSAEATRRYEELLIAFRGISPDSNVEIRSRAEL